MEKLQEAQDPNRKIRAKPTRRTPHGTPVGTPGSVQGALQTANFMAAALLQPGLTHAGMMNALLSASSLSMPGATPGSAGTLTNPLATPATAGAAPSASEDGSAAPAAPGSAATAEGDAAAAAAASAAANAELQRQLTSLPGIQQLAGPGALLGAGTAAGANPAAGALPAAVVTNEAGMWAMLDQVALALPDGGVFDSFLPSFEAKALSVLYCTSPGGATQYNIALWKDGQLLGQSPFQSLEDAKKALADTSALAQSFATSAAPLKQEGGADGASGNPSSPNSAAAAAAAATAMAAALQGFPGLSGMTSDAMAAAAASMTEEQLRALYAPLFTQAGSAPGSSAARGAFPGIGGAHRGPRSAVALLNMVSFRHQSTPQSSEQTQPVAPSSPPQRGTCMQISADCCCGCAAAVVHSLLPCLPRCPAAGEGLLAPGPNLNLPFPTGEAGQSDAMSQQMMELFQQQQTQELLRQMQTLQGLASAGVDGTGQEGQEGVKADPAVTAEHLQVLQQQQQQLALVLEQQAEAMAAAAAAVGAAAGGTDEQQLQLGAAAEAAPEALASAGEAAAVAEAQQAVAPIANGAAAAAPQGATGEEGQNPDSEAIMALNQLRYASGELSAADADAAAAAAAAAVANGGQALGGEAGTGVQDGGVQDAGLKRSAPEDAQGAQGTEEGGGKRARTEA